MPTKGVEMKKPLAVSIILSIPILSFSQRPDPEKVITELYPFNQGIYLSKEEFLTNNPSIPHQFEVQNQISENYASPDERYNFYVKYHDDMGYTKVLAASDIWGYCDDGSVYVSFQGRPFELVYLGAISLLRYKEPNQRTVFSQILSFYLAGYSAATMDRAQEVLFHLKTDSVIIPTCRNIRKLISEDKELYSDYSRDRKMDYFEKNLMYLEKYNEKYPVIFTGSEILFTEPAITDDLVEKN
jgi:hypothetical protein